jgi:hypothetical protein
MAGAPPSRCRQLSCRPISVTCRGSPACRGKARFSGRWTGKWKGQLEHVLVIELLAQNANTEVTAVSAWGVAPEARSGHARVDASPRPIEDGVLRLDLRRVSSRAAYAFQADGTLVAQCWRGDSHHVGRTADGGPEGRSVSARLPRGAAGVSGCQP